MLLPDQSLTIQVPYENNSVISVEPWDQNVNTKWPLPQLCTVQNKAITLTNGTQEPVLLGKDIKMLQLRTTMEMQPQSETVSVQSYAANHMLTPPTLPTVSAAAPEAVTVLEKAHNKYAAVFDNDLTQGYNGAFGPHTCKLNWASDKRPTADQVRMVSYSHDLKQLHQMVCDELTQQNVLGIPQEHNVNVQFVCPSFLRRKPKAKNKPNHLLTTNDVRLVVNFSPINDHLKNIPSVKTTPNDILVTLGRWKHIIVFDLYQGFFQNHMPTSDGK
jgi:hypothetical protein